MDRLEEYIKQNRDELDKYTPSSGLWKGIRNDLHRPGISRMKWLAAAAMALVIIISSVLYYAGEYGRKTLYGTNDESLFLRTNPELKETEIYYNTLFNELYNRGSALLTDNPEAEKELQYDLSHLDSLCFEIRKDLNDNIANEDVIEALIVNYRTRIQILEEMLEVLSHEEENPINPMNHAL